MKFFFICLVLTTLAKVWFFAIRVFSSPVQSCTACRRPWTVQVERGRDNDSIFRTFHFANGYLWCKRLKDVKCIAEQIINKNPSAKDQVSQRKSSINRNRIVCNCLKLRRPWYGSIDESWFNSLLWVYVCTIRGRLRRSTWVNAITFYCYVIRNCEISKSIIHNLCWTDTVYAISYGTKPISRYRWALSLSFKVSWLTLRLRPVGWIRVWTNFSHYLSKHTLR